MRTRTLISFDYAIKRLLRNKADYEVVEGLLTVLLEKPVRITQVLESESNPENGADKFNRVDILVSDEEGELFIIELQFSYEIDYFQRMLYGTSKALVERMSAGKKYAEVKKIYSVNIVYFDLGMGDDYAYHGTTRFIGLHDGDELKLSPYQQQQFNKLTPAELFPEYYILKVNRFNDLAKTHLDEWMFYLKNSKVREDFTAPGLKKAGELLNEALMSEDERRAYERMVHFKRCEQSDIESALFIGKQDGREEGRAEGHEEGLKKGLKEGLEKGRAEEKKATVLLSHQAGLPLDTISAITGLSPEAVRSIVMRK